MTNPLKSGTIKKAMTLLALSLAVEVAYAIPTELEQIPLIREQFYIPTIAQLVIYLTVAALLIGLGLIIAGSFGGGERAEAAGLYVKGKKLFFVALMVIFLVAALGAIMNFVLGAGGTTDVDVPEF